MALKKIKGPVIVQAGKTYAEWSRKRFVKAGGTTWVGTLVKAGRDPSVIKRIWVWGELQHAITFFPSVLTARHRFKRRRFCMRASSHRAVRSADAVASLFRGTEQLYDGRDRHSCSEL